MFDRIFMTGLAILATTVAIVGADIVAQAAAQKHIWTTPDVWWCLVSWLVVAFAAGLALFTWGMAIGEWRQLRS